MNCLAPRDTSAPEAGKVNLPTRVRCSRREQGERGEDAEMRSWCCRLPFVEAPAPPLSSHPPPRMTETYLSESSAMSTHKGSALAGGKAPGGKWPVGAHWP